MAIKKEKAPTNKLTCNCCGKELTPTNGFYRSYSEMNKHTGRTPICKDCINKRYLQLLKLYSGDEKSALKHTLMNIDMYFDEDVFLLCEQEADDENMISTYVTKLNKKPDVRSNSSANNIKGMDITNETVLDDISMEALERWGGGRSRDEYMKLEKMYFNYLDSYPSETLQEKEIIMQLCELKVEKEKYRINGNNNAYDKICEQIRKTMGDLDIIPSKKKAYGDDRNMMIGKLIEEVEKNEPIPEIHEDFNDIDKFKYMLERYFIKPIRKSLGLDTQNYTYEDEINEDKK